MTTSNKAKPTASKRGNSKAKPKITRLDQLQKLLTRDKGASIAEMTKATGWQSHSVRAALSGLRKKGFAIERTKRGNVSSYHIVEVSS